MRIVDAHSHWETRRGYMLRTDAALAQQYDVLARVFHRNAERLFGLSEPAAAGEA
jgi:hypothetical protein